MLFEITRDHLAESLLPLLVYSQRQLSRRLKKTEQFANVHPLVTYDPDTGVPLEVKLLQGTPIAIEIGAHIDPDGHNLYNVPGDGQRYALVNLNWDDILKRLSKSVDVKVYSARMLENSRKLLLAYLAGSYASIL